MSGLLRRRFKQCFPKVPEPPVMSMLLDTGCLACSAWISHIMRLPVRLAGIVGAENGPAGSRFNGEVVAPLQDPAVLGREDNFVKDIGGHRGLNGPLDQGFSSAELQVFIREPVAFAFGW